MKTTPLHHSHVHMGARVTEFAGWELPLYYHSILDEVGAVRQRAGLFDVSHMGRLLVSGRDAAAFLQHLTTNDVDSLDVGRGHYNLLCNERGGVIDDLTIFRNDVDTYLLIVNAANTSKDLAWIDSHLSGDVTVEDITDETTLLALQGPDSRDVLKAITGGDLPDLSRFSCAPVRIADVECIICRSGYTGEVGYEIRTSVAHANAVWEALLAAGPVSGVTPCGLGARDVLRLEAGYVLYGHELDEDINPIQAGLSRFVRIDKSDFIGCRALRQILDVGPAKALCGIRMNDRTVPRPGAPITINGADIGSVTSGTFSPTIMRGIALAYVETKINQPGLEVEVILREKPHKGLIVKPPFY